MLVLKSWVLLARYAAKRLQDNGDKGYKLIRKIKAVALIWVAALFLSHYEKALLSIADGRASSFFNTFIKIITPPPFFYGQRISGAKIRRKIGKFRENQRNSEKNREKSEKNGEIRIKIGEIRINSDMFK